MACSVISYIRGTFNYDTFSFLDDRFSQPLNAFQETTDFFFAKKEHSCQHFRTNTEQIYFS